MSSTLRRILAVILASGVALGIKYLLEELASQVSMPAGLDTTNPDQVKFALEHGEFPFASLALVLAGWLVASYAGSRVAVNVGRSRASVIGFTIIFTLAVVRDLTLMPHPEWMWIGGVLGVPLIALGAAGETISIPSL